LEKLLDYYPKMVMSRLESIEIADILYRDYPEVYERFRTRLSLTIYEQLPGIIDLRGKRIADVELDG
jgi:hypothetical protein